MTVYSSAGNLVATIPDSVDMSKFGFQGHPGTTQGAPVEAAFTPDSRYVYVSNYSMYGAGFGPEGSDTCTPSSAQAAGDTDSYVYRIDTRTLAIDQVIEVGLVPKFLAVSPNGKWLLVSNWCSYDLSIVNIAEAKSVATCRWGRIREASRSRPTLRLPMWPSWAEARWSRSVWPRSRRSGPSTSVTTLATSSWTRPASTSTCR